MSGSSPKEPLIGAHTSAAGGSFNALKHGHAIGATTIQLFTSNQRQWGSRKISEEEVATWEALRKETHLTIVMSHDSYLINLGSNKPDLLEKSRKAFKEELERCHLLKINFLNFHPGASTGASVESCLDTIIESMLQLESLAKKGHTRLLFETTAGQGSTVGWNFDEIGYLIKHTHRKMPVGVCIDTCHIFSAGYDIRTKAGWNHTLKEFDEKIGLDHLYAMHLNDSKCPLGSRKDRHEQIGKGEIGMESFEVVMTHPKLKSLPKYLETPDPELWPKEIAMLKEFAKGSHHVHH